MMAATANTTATSAPRGRPVRKARAGGANAAGGGTPRRMWVAAIALRAGAAWSAAGRSDGRSAGAWKAAAGAATRRGARASTSFAQDLRAAVTSSRSRSRRSACTWRRQRDARRAARRSRRAQARPHSLSPPVSSIFGARLRAPWAGPAARRDAGSAAILPVDVTREWTPQSRRVGALGMKCGMTMEWTPWASGCRSPSSSCRTRRWCR